ncbi:MAG: site-2 protease family protein [SAR202 cluster bacterium]|nr:site-2 protease family protein [SAR202 cluster bacterium]
MEAVLIALAAFIPMLTLLVVVHELGHFFTGKYFKIKVLEFGIGYPPRAFGIYTGRTLVRLDQATQFVNLSGAQDLKPGMLVKVGSAEFGDGTLVARVIELPQRGRAKAPKEEKGKDAKVKDEFLRHEGKIRSVDGSSIILGDMVYSVNWTPLGGFVKLAGENDPAVPRSLAGKSVLARAIVLAAGSAMNAVLPIFIFSLMFLIPHDVAVGDVTIAEIQPASPAAAAGLRSGDVIVRAGGRDIEVQQDLTRAITLSQGSSMEWEVLREGQPRIVQITPRTNPPEGQGPTGVRIVTENIHMETRADPPWGAVPKAFTSTWEILVLLRHEVSGWFGGGASPEFSGPIGIAQVTGEVTREGGFNGWLNLAVLFSINLAILNILPIPMLDGGRLLFVLVEWVRRGKRIPPEREGLVHLVGFVLLIVFVLLISAKDIQRLLEGRSFLGG